MCSAYVSDITTNEKPSDADREKENCDFRAFFFLFGNLVMKDIHWRHTYTHDDAQTHALLSITDYHHVNSHEIISFLLTWWWIVFSVDVLRGGRTQKVNTLFTSRFFYSPENIASYLNLFYTFDPFHHWWVVLLHSRSYFSWTMLWHPLCILCAYGKLNWYNV